MEKIKVGSFVRMADVRGGQSWSEVVRINRPLMTSEPKPETTYHARHWTQHRNEWSYFTLAPEWAHKDFIVEVLNLDPAVADIFRETTLKEK